MSSIMNRRSHKADCCRADTSPDVEICRFGSGKGLEDHLSRAGVAGDCLLQDLSIEEEGPGGILRCSDTIDLLKKAELR